MLLLWPVPPERSCASVMPRAATLPIYNCNMFAQTVLKTLLYLLCICYKIEYVYGMYYSGKGSRRLVDICTQFFVDTEWCLKVCSGRVFPHFVRTHSLKVINALNWQGTRPQSFFSSFFLYWLVFFFTLVCWRRPIKILIRTIISSEWEYNVTFLLYFAIYFNPCKAFEDFNKQHCCWTVIRIFLFITPIITLKSCNWLC